MNKSYFKWLLKSHKIPVAFLFILYVAIIAMSIASYSGYDNSRMDILENVMITASIISFFAAAVLPVFVFAYVHKKSNADRMLALPISRKEQCITNFVYILGISFGSWLVVTLGLSVLFINQVTVSGLLYCILMQFLVDLAISLLDTCFFLLGNSLLDGIVICAAYNFLGIITMACVAMFLETLTIGMEISSVDFMFYLTPGLLCGEHVLLGTGALTKGIAVLPKQADFSLILLYVLLFIYIAGGLLGVKKEYIQRKSERAEQISDHPFAYPFLIHWYLSVSLLMLGASLVKDFEVSYAIPYLLLLAVYIFAMFIYKRKIAVTLKAILTYIGIVLLTLLISWIGFQTHGFHLSDRNQLDTSKDIRIYYRGEVQMNDDTYGYASFRLEIPAGSLSSFQEVYNLLELRRQQTVNIFYQEDGNFSAYAYAYFANIDISKEYYDETQSNTMNYGEFTNLSKEDLELIDTYTDVTVESYENENIYTIEDIYE